MRKKNLPGLELEECLLASLSPESERADRFGLKPHRLTLPRMQRLPPRHPLHGRKEEGQPQTPSLTASSVITNQKPAGAGGPIFLPRRG